MWSAHPFPIAVPYVSFPYPPFASCLPLHLSTHPSSQASDGYHKPCSPLQRGHQFTAYTNFFSSPIFALHQFWTFGRVIILLWIRYYFIIKAIVVTCISHCCKLYIFWPCYSENILIGDNCCIQSACKYDGWFS